MPVKRTPVLAASLAVAAVLAPPAMAVTSVTAAFPETIVEAIQDMGYRAELDIDNYGDPMIRSAAAGVNFVINFYNCEANQDCSDLHFSVAFDMPNGMDMYAMNSWNREMLLGMAYLDDDNDPVIQHYVASVDGMSRSNFVATFSQWVEALDGFTDFIDW